MRSLLLGSVLLLMIMPVQGAQLVYDDFADASGGMPDNWAMTFGSATVTEQGSVITIDDPNGDASVIAPTGLPLFDLTGETMTAILNIDSLGGTATPYCQFGPTSTDSMSSFDFFLVRVVADGTLSVHVASDAVTDDITLTTLPSYAGGEITLTLIMDADSFTVSTDVDSYTSGDLTYASTFTNGFTLASLTTTATVMIWNEAGGTGTLTNEIDLIDVSDTSSGTVDVPAANPILLLLAISVVMIITLRRR